MKAKDVVGWRRELCIEFDAALFEQHKFVADESGGCAVGTPQGVILGEKLPAMMRRWVKPGDEVVSVIEGLGELNVFTADPARTKPMETMPTAAATVDRRYALDGGLASLRTGRNTRPEWTRACRWPSAATAT